MSDQSKIEWTDATWNVVTGCTVVSPGCTNCYAMGLAGTRLKHHPSRAGLTDDSRAGPVWNGEVRFNEQWLDQPLRWRKPRSIFVCAHGDLFHPAVPDEWTDRVFAVMAMAPHHRFQVLTKRSDRMRAYFEARRDGDPWAEAADEIADLIGMEAHPYVLEPSHLPLPNVWLGVSVEDQTRADERIPDLLATPAAVRWISAEPLLGPVDLQKIGNLTTIRTAFPDVVKAEERHMHPEPISGFQINVIGTQHRHQGIAYYQTPNHMGGFSIGTKRWPHLDWVVVGGESGPSARPMHPDWARSLRDQCQAAGAAYFFKQWGAWMPWQPGSAPMWNAQNGTSEDGNILFPENMDDAPDWDDGLNHYEPGVTDHCAFQKVGKARAGRLLDGREWNEVPV